MHISSPAVTRVAVTSLAIGIGANCAAFSWADALLLRPLTVTRPGEVLTVGSSMSVEGFSSLRTSYREYVDLRNSTQNNKTQTTNNNTTNNKTKTQNTQPKHTQGLMVSGNFFAVMGVEPELG